MTTTTADPPDEMDEDETGRDISLEKGRTTTGDYMPALSAQDQAWADQHLFRYEREGQLPDTSSTDDIMVDGYDVGRHSDDLGARLQRTPGVQGDDLDDEYQSSTDVVLMNPEKVSQIKNPETGRPRKVTHTLTADEYDRYLWDLDEARQPGEPPARRTVERPFTRDELAAQQEPDPHEWASWPTDSRGRPIPPPPPRPVLSDIDLVEEEDDEDDYDLAWYSIDDDADDLASWELDMDPSDRWQPPSIVEPPKVEPAPEPQPTPVVKTCSNPNGCTNAREGSSSLCSACKRYLSRNGKHRPRKLTTRTT